MIIDLKRIKSIVIEICTQVLQNDDLKQIVEKAQSVDELVNILNNNRLSSSEKQIKSYKILLKNKIKENPDYGPITKNVFENIADSDIRPEEMVKRYFEYIAINDVRS